MLQVYATYLIDDEFDFTSLPMLVQLQNSLSVIDSDFEQIRAVKVKGKLCREEVVSLLRLDVVVESESR